MANSTTQFVCSLEIVLASLAKNRKLRYMKVRRVSTCTRQKVKPCRESTRTGLFRDAIKQSPGKFECCSHVLHDEFKVALREGAMWYSKQTTSRHISQF